MNCEARVGELFSFSSIALSHSSFTRREESNRKKNYLYFIACSFFLCSGSGFIGSSLLCRCDVVVNIVEHTHTHNTEHTYLPVIRFAVHVTFFFLWIQNLSSLREISVSIAMPRERESQTISSNSAFIGYVNDDRRENSFVGWYARAGKKRQQATVCDVLNAWIMCFDRALNERNGYATRWKPIQFFFLLVLFYFGWMRASECQTIFAFIFHCIERPQSFKMKKSDGKPLKLISHARLKRFAARQWMGIIISEITNVNKLNGWPTVSWTKTLIGCLLAWTLWCLAHCMTLWRFFSISISTSSVHPLSYSRHPSFV